MSSSISRCINNAVCENLISTAFQSCSYSTQILPCLLLWFVTCSTSVLSQSPKYFPLQGNGEWISQEHGPSKSRRNFSHNQTYHYIVLPGTEIPKCNSMWPVDNVKRLLLCTLREILRFNTVVILTIWKYFTKIHYLPASKIDWLSKGVKLGVNGSRSSELRPSFKLGFLFPLTASVRIEAFIPSKLPSVPACVS